MKRYRTFVGPYRRYLYKRRRIEVRVDDKIDPARARWLLQHAMSRAGGFRTFGGFNNHVARTGRRHSFLMRERYLDRFVQDVRPLVARGRVSVEIDGRELRVLKIPRR